MAILMEEGYWRNSQFSVARFYGGIVVKSGGKQHEMKIVNKHGITLEELSDPDSKHYVQDGMAINPGEPADLVDVEFIKYYKKLGRDKFIEILDSNNHATRQKLHELYEVALAEKKLKIGSAVLTDGTASSK